MARLMHRIIEQHNLSPQPFVLENKEKGLGVEALRYLKAHQGNNHVIMVTLNSFYTTSLRWPGSVADVMSYAPIARMAEDPFLLCVADHKRDPLGPQTSQK